MVTYRQFTKIDTPSQQWARDNGACYYGRRALGAQSLADYYRTTTNMDHVLWIAQHLLPGTVGLDLNAAHEKKRQYSLRVACHHFSGRWAVLYTRRSLAKIFAEYHVQFPAALL
jgi:hypothetical protein